MHNMHSTAKGKEMVREEIIEIKQDVASIKKTLEEIKTVLGIGSPPPATILTLRKQAEDIVSDIIKKKNGNKTDSRQ